MRRSVLLLVLAAGSTLPAPILGEVSPANRAAENQTLVQRLVLDRAAAIASSQRIADEREEQLFVELAAKDRRLRAEEHTRKEAQADLVKVTAERQQLVAESAARSRQFAVEVDEAGREDAFMADSAEPLVH